MHNTHVLRNGDVMQSAKFLPMPRFTEAQKARFFDGIISDTGCHVWRGHSQANGYGRFSAFGRLYRANRVAFFLSNKVDPGPLYVCHTCDNRACVNPKHLWLGTPRQNTADMMVKRGLPAPDASRPPRMFKGISPRKKCKNGHNFPKPIPGKPRRCRDCYNAWSRERYAKQVAV